MTSNSAIWKENLRAEKHSDWSELLGWCKNPQSRHVHHCKVMSPSYKTNSISPSPSIYNPVSTTNAQSNLIAWNFLIRKCLPTKSYPPHMKNGWELPRNGRSIYICVYIHILYIYTVYIYIYIMVYWWENHITKAIRIRFGILFWIRALGNSASKNPGLGSVARNEVIHGLGFITRARITTILTYHLVMTNIAVENPINKWRFLAGKIIYFYGPSKNHG